MDLYEIWNENRTRIPEGRYSLRCVKAAKSSFWLEGKGGWGKSEKVMMMFEVFSTGDYHGALIPMFFALSDDGKIHQGSKYYQCWCVANGLRKPARGRLKEMPPSKFLNKVFSGDVVTVKPKYENGQEQPELFHYSKVQRLYELEVGNPDL